MAPAYLTYIEMPSSHEVCPRFGATTKIFFFYSPVYGNLKYALVLYLTSRHLPGNVVV